MNFFGLSFLLSTQSLGRASDVFMRPVALSVVHFDKHQMKMAEHEKCTTILLFFRASNALQITFNRLENMGKVYERRAER